MGSVLLALLLSADPTVAVVLARRTSVSQAEAVTLTESTAQALLNQQVPGLLPLAEVNRRLAKVAMSDATMCAGKPACLAELGRQLEVSWLVLVSVSQVAGEQSLAIELANAATGAVADNESLLLAQNGQVPMDMLKPFAVRLSARLRGEATDAPKVTTLVPTPVEPALPELPAPPSKSKSHVPSVVLGGAGVAALGVGVALLVMGLGGQARLSAGDPGPDGTTLSPLTGSEALALNGSTSLQLALSGAAAAVGLGLGATAIAVW